MRLGDHIFWQYSLISTTETDRERERGGEGEGDFQEHIRVPEGHAFFAAHVSVCQRPPSPTFTVA